MESVPTVLAATVLAAGRMQRAAGGFILRDPCRFSLGARLRASGIGAARGNTKMSDPYSNDEETRSGLRAAVQELRKLVDALRLEIAADA